MKMVGISATEMEIVVAKVVRNTLTLKKLFLDEKKIREIWS
jgi:hypothetical protein